VPGVDQHAAIRGNLARIIQPIQQEARPAEALQRQLCNRALILIQQVHGRVHMRARVQRGMQGIAVVIIAAQKALLHKARLHIAGIDRHDIANAMRKIDDRHFPASLAKIFCAMGAATAPPVPAFSTATHTAKG